MNRTAPFAVNWQIKQSPFGAGNEVHTDLKKLVTLVRLSGYRGYLPIETLSVRGAEYDPFQVVPPFLAELRQAMEDTKDVAPPPSTAADETPVVSAPPTTAAAPERRTRKPANRDKDKPPQGPEPKP
jgi:hypothetical protein